MNFLFLCIQSGVCVVCVLAAKRAGVRTLHQKSLLPASS